MTKKPAKKLNPKQEAFCQLFASEAEFFGNGVQSYIEAYDIDATKPGAYAAARVSAHKLLTKSNITDRINEIFEARGLNDTFVDKQLEKLITQDADFTNKMKAITEYNKLKGRITAKTDITGNMKVSHGRPYEGLTKEEILAALKKGKSSAEPN